MSKSKGFTLIELLIVVAIIAILATIAIPQFTKYRKNAAKAACIADLRNALTQCAAYLAEHPDASIDDCDSNISDTQNVDITDFGNDTNDNIYVKGTCKGAYSGKTITLWSNGIVEEE